jgi:hypothetical protein
VSDVLLFVLATLAAYRVTRLVTTDKIAEPLMDRIRFGLERRWYAKHGPVGSDTHFNSKWAYLLSCPWCLGFWVSGVMTVVLSIAYGLDYPIITWLAMSTVVGFLGGADNE